MFGLLFSKNSPLIFGLEIVAIYLAAHKITTLSFSSAITFCFIATIMLYLFLRMCAMLRWYPTAYYRGRVLRHYFPGIELHFRKAMVPTAYVMVLTMSWLALGGSSYILVLSTILLVAIAHVNAILIFLHFKDESNHPVNFLTTLEKRS